MKALFTLERPRYTVGLNHTQTFTIQANFDQVWSHKYINIQSGQNPAKVKSYKPLLNKVLNCPSWSRIAVSVAENCCLWTVSVWLEKRYYTGFRGQRSLCVFALLTRVSFRFTIGAATPLEKKKTGPSQADVEAIKVHFSVFKGVTDISFPSIPSNAVVIYTVFFKKGILSRWGILESRDSIVHHLILISCFPRMLLLMRHRWQRWRGWRGCCRQVRSLAEISDQVIKHAVHPTRTSLWDGAINKQKKS